MSSGNARDSPWTDIEPRLWISESDVPERARRLSSTVDEWFGNYTEYVDPFNWEEIDTQFIRKKAFHELSSYLLAARGLTDETPLPAIHDLLVERVNDPRYVHLMSRSPREFHHFTFPFIYAGYVNELESDARKQLGAVVDEGAFWDAERVPSRQLEYHFTFECFSRLFGFTQDVYDADTALEQSLLNHQPNVVRCILPDAYCLTHDVFFYNNHFGIFPGAFPDEPAPYDVSSLLRALILRYMATNNCDIVLELVYAGVLQRQISRQLVQLVLSWVTEKVEDRGYVPGPDTDKAAQLNTVEVGGPPPGTDRAAGTEDGIGNEALWERNFHTNQIAGMTARIIERDWDELETRPIGLDLGERHVRRDLTRLGQVLSSLAAYDLKTGARQLRRIADSPVVREYDGLRTDVVDFLGNQRAMNGDFGYWTKEEIAYTSQGHSADAFRTRLVDPVSDLCRDALDAIDREGHSDQSE